MTKQHNKTVLAIGLCIAAVATVQTSHGQTIDTIVQTSGSGLGEIDFTPGENVSQFVIYGSGAPYAMTPSTTLSTTISGDGAPAYGGEYSATYVNWTSGASGTTGGTSGTTDNVPPNGCGGVEPISNPNSYGVTPWTQASISLTAPATAFQLDFLVHDYYANANLNVTLNGATVGAFNNIMSSSGTRNCDYLYTENINGVNVGDNLTFTFDGLQALDGSSWANIDIMAAAVNLTPPSDVSSLPQTTLPNTAAVPEPATLLLAVSGGLGVFSFLRKR